MFAKVPPKSKKKDASHLDTKSKETDIVIDSDMTYLTKNTMKCNGL